MKYFVKKATRYGSPLDIKTFYSQWNQGNLNILTIITMSKFPWWNIWSPELVCPFLTTPHAISSY